MTDAEPAPIVTLPNGITLRAFRESDADRLPLLMNNKKIWDNLRDRLPHPYERKHAEEWIKMNKDTTGVQYCPSGPEKSGETYLSGDKWTGPRVCGNYAICINDELVGSVGLMFEADVARRYAEIGYW